MGLYRHIPPPGENIPVSVETFQVKELVPTEEKIEWAVKRFRNNRSGPPSGMRAKHLTGWLAEARKEETEAEEAKSAEEIIGLGGEDPEEKRETYTEEMTYWEKVVALAREDFGEGQMEEESMWQVLVLIPKGKGDYRGLGLVEVV